MKLKEKRENKFLLMATSFLGIFLVLQVPGRTDDNIPSAVGRVLENARLSEVAGLKLLRYRHARLVQNNIYDAIWEYVTDLEYPERSDLLVVHLNYFAHICKTKEEWRELSKQDKDIFLRPILRVYEVDGYPTVIVTEGPDELVGGFWQGPVYIVMQFAGKKIANYSTYNDAFRDIYQTIKDYTSPGDLEERREVTEEAKKEEKIRKEVSPPRQERVAPYHIGISKQYTAVVKKGKAQPLGQIWIKNNSSVTAEDVVVTFSQSQNGRITFENPAQRTVYIGKILAGETKEVFDLVPPLIRGIKEGKDSVKFTINGSNLTKSIQGEMNFKVVSLYHEGEKEPLEGLPPGVVGWKLTKSQLPEAIQLQIPQETYIGGFELEFSDWGAQISRIPALLSGFWKALGIVDSIRENGLATAIKEMAIEEGLKEISPGLARIYGGGQVLLELASKKANVISIGSAAGQEIADYFDKAIEPAYRFHELVDKEALSPLRIIAVRIHGWNRELQLFEGGLRFFFLNGAGYWEEYAKSLVYIEIDLCRTPENTHGLNLRVDPFPIDVRSGQIRVLEISLENLSPSERDETYIGGDIEESGRDIIAKLKVGDVDFIGFYITSLAPGEVWISPVSIGITGIKKGSTKLIIQVSEAGKEPLRWEIPVMVK